MGAHGLPQWAPLEKVVPEGERIDWMWMGTVIRGDRHIEQYKHCDTRGYLSLDSTGQAWKVRYSDVPGEPADVRPISTADAMARALRLEPA